MQLKGMLISSGLEHTGGWIIALYLLPVCLVGLGKSALHAPFPFCKMEIMSLTFVRHFKT